MLSSMIWEELEAFPRLYRSTLRINSLIYNSVSEIVSKASSLTLFIFARLMISLVWLTISIMLGYPSECKHRKSLQISQNSFAAMLNIVLNCSLLVLVSSSLLVEFIEIQSQLIIESKLNWAVDPSLRGFLPSRSLLPFHKVGSSRQVFALRLNDVSSLSCLKGKGILAENRF